jgi:hypothetical protein
VKVGSAQIQALESPDVPPIPNPDGREWHPFTLEEWREACESPMASQWLPSDWRGVARLAILWDNFYKNPQNLECIKEIRLQSPGYGLNPLDRSRLQWEVARADESEQKQARRRPERQTGTDPRSILSMVDLGTRLKP